MSVSVVNGFMCFSSCDAAKAAKGENPHPKPDAAIPAENKGGAGSAARETPAVVFGGTLASQRNSVAPDGAGQATGAASAPTPTFTFETVA